MSAEPRFTLTQMIAIVAAVGGMSGFGGAFTATATDAEQDTKIEAIEESIEKLEVKQDKTHDSVIVNGIKVDHVTDQISDLRDETKDINKLLREIAVQVAK